MSMKINGIILSAGLSSRMEAFKPLLEYNGQTFVTSILQKLYPVCNRVGIVTGFKNEEVANTVKNYIQEFKYDRNKLNLVYNSDYDRGMFSSLQCGLTELSDCDWLLYHFVDQPHLPIVFYQEIVNQMENDSDWIQPEYNQKKGHPILINQSLFSIIQDSKYTSLKEISQLPEIKKKIWNCKYPQIIEDIDTQEDYQKLI